MVEEGVEEVVVSSIREDEEIFRSVWMCFDDYVFHGHSVPYRAGL